MYSDDIDHKELQHRAINDIIARIGSQRFIELTEEFRDNGDAGFKPFALYCHSMRIKLFPAKAWYDFTFGE